VRAGQAQTATPSQFRTSLGILIRRDRCRVMAALHRRLDWAKDNERRAAELRAKQQRMAHHYAMPTRQQEERENAEARERFTARR